MQWGRGAMVVRAVAVVVAGVLVVAGCSGDPGPTTTPVVTSTPTVEPTPEPDPEPAPEAVPPERPAAMDTVDADGAEAAVTYFLSLYPYVYATGDLQEWRELSDPECIFCTSVIDNVEALVDKDQHSVGGLVTLSELESRPVDQGDAWMVQVRLHQEASTNVDADGAVVDEYSVETVDNSVFVFHDGSQWWIRGVDHTRVE